MTVFSAAHHVIFGSSLWVFAIMAATTIAATVVGERDERDPAAEQRVRR